MPLVAFYLYPLIILDGNPTPSMLFCSSYLKPSSGAFALSIINSAIFAIPSWISTCCYFIIGIKSYKKLNQMKNEAIESNDNELVFRIHNQKYSLIYQLSAVFTVFNFSYMPVYITMILRVAIGYKRSPIVDAIMTETILISRLIDPFITIAFQPELNHEFKVLITKSKAKLKSFIPYLLQ